MIVILSQDPDAVAAISRNQANVPLSTHGRKQPLALAMSSVGANDNLYIVADQATRLTNWAPVIGDEATGTYWDAALTMSLLDKVIPQSFSGNVYISACNVDDPLSGMRFAGTFKTVLSEARTNAGGVYGETGAALGPIPDAGDQRWIEAQAATVISSPPMPQQQGTTTNPLIPVLYNLS